MLLLTVALAQSDPDDMRARELYENGAILYEEGEYEQAIAAWEAAYDLSEEPLLYYNIANAYERLGRYDEAIDALAQYRAFAPSEERESLDRRLRNLEKRRDEQAASAPVKPPSKERSSDLDLDLGVVSLVGVGVVGLGTGAAMGLRSRSASSELSLVCVDGLCPTDSAETLQTQRRSAIAADIGFVVGAVALGTGATLWLIDDTAYLAPAPGGVTLGGSF